MKGGLFAIMQKEFRRFFTDGRMVFSTILLPGLLIFLIYSFIGGAMSSNLTVSDDYDPQLYAVNLPDSLAEEYLAAGLDFELVDLSQAEAIKEAIVAKEADVLAVFPENFDAHISAIIDGSASESSVPEVAFFYNSTRIESSNVFGQLVEMLSAYKETLQPLFTVNTGEANYDLASKEDATGFMFASLLPMLLMIFLYTGCMAVAPESIAGEKERGTIATLLVTPLKRWELALGKVMSLCIIALLSGASSFVGVMLSLPRLFQMTDAEGSSFFGDTALYGLHDYLLLLVVILSTVVLFVGLISIISAFARTTKEANTLVMPLMIVVMLVGATAMFQTSSETNVLFYCVPIYNSVQSMVAIFSFSAEPTALVLTAAINVAAAVLCVVVLTRMFESERIIFSK